MNRFYSRRGFLRGTCIICAAIWGGNTLDAMMQKVNTASKPSEHKIIDRGGLVDGIEKPVASKRSFILVTVFAQ